MDVNIELQPDLIVVAQSGLRLSRLLPLSHLEFKFKMDVLDISQVVHLFQLPQTLFHFGHIAQHIAHLSKICHLRMARFYDEKAPALDKPPKGLLLPLAAIQPHQCGCLKRQMQRGLWKCLRHRGKASLEAPCWSFCTSLGSPEPPGSASGGWQ